MKKLLSIIAGVGSLLLLAATPTQKQSEYISRWSDVAQKEMARTGVPASITLAQAMLESGTGQSELALQANNHFGIKSMSTYHGPVYKIKTKEFLNGKWVVVDAQFRKYTSGEQSFSDHSDFLRYSARYKPLFELDPADYKGWAKGLGKAGYATDPEYPNKLIRLIEECDLARFDSKPVNSQVTLPVSGEVEQKVEQVVIPTPPTPLSLEKEEEVVSRIGTEHYTYKINRKVFRVNSTNFVKAHKGESYSSIAKLFDLFHGEILAFNDVKNDHPLVEGERVFIQKKMARSVKGLDKHVISEKCESLWSISQEYGVRLKSIYRLNRINSSYVPKEGDVIILR